MVRQDPWHAERLPAVFQCVGGGSARARGRGSRSGDAFDSAAFRGGADGQTGNTLRGRLRDAGWHLHSRLYPCDGPGAGAYRGGRGAVRGWRVEEIQRRDGAWVFGEGSPERGGEGDGEEGAVCDGAAP